MDIERRLSEALRHHRMDQETSWPDLFKEPSVGSVIENEFGSVWMVETTYDEGYMHGRVELSSEIPTSALEFFDSNCAFKGFDFGKAAVIDTETTSLAGGTGTYPFIIGIGFWNRNRFIVRQYILRDFFEEPAQLQAFSNDLDYTSCLLTYNGKTFDIPLLRTRYRINRMAIPFIDYPHLDLVHPCRRIYKEHFESFKLSFLEAMVLGFERTDDVPSHLIPGIYFDFLQNRNEDLLRPILNHNRDDIMSLYLLAQETARRIEHALSNGCNDDLMFLSLGRILFKAKQYERARILLGSIRPEFAPEKVAEESMMIKSLAAKRTRDWENAQSIWREMMRSGRFGCYPHMELAKHHEHRLRDFGSAIDLTNSAMRLVEFEREFMPIAEYGNLYASLKRRQRRLLRRISSNKKGAGQP